MMDKDTGYTPSIDLGDIYVNSQTRSFNRYKTPKKRKFNECPFEQWKEYYIADRSPNLTENIINEPVTSPLTGEMEFLKVPLLTVLNFGEISDYLAERIRSEITKANLTGVSPAGGLRDLVLEEIKLGNTAIINKVFKNAPDSQNGGKAETWWREQGITELNL